MVFRYRPTSSLYRPDVGLISLTTSGRHRANVQTWSRPDISRHLPMSARYNFTTPGRYRGRHFPISGRRRTAMVFRYRPTSSLYRPDVGLISLTHLADIEPTCKHGVGPISAISRHLPMSARYNFRHQTDVAADISRCRADTEPLLFSDIGPTSSLYRPDVGLISLTTSGRHRAHVQTWSRPDISHQPTFADVGPI